MKKAMSLMVAMVLVAVSLAQGALLSEDFETYYTPGTTVNVSDWGNKNSHANPALWAGSGWGNWSEQTNNGSANDYMFINNVHGGTSTAGFSTIQDNLGFNSSVARVYSVDLLNYNLNTDGNSYFGFGVIEGGNSIITATDGLSFWFSPWNFSLQSKKNGVVTNLWSGQADSNSNRITQIKLTLDSTSYDVEVAGMGGAWSVTGSSSGLLTDPALSTGKVSVEMWNDTYGGPANASVDNILVTPEPVTFGLLTLGALILRRRK